MKINGKKRTVLNVLRDIKEEELIEEVNKDKNLQKYLHNQNIKKKIFIKNKLINLIL